MDFLTSIITPSVIMLNAILSSVEILKVVAPFNIIRGFRQRMKLLERWFSPWHQEKNSANYENFQFHSQNAKLEFGFY
jgi:hypothetical protein